MLKQIKGFFFTLKFGDNFSFVYLPLSIKQYLISNISTHFFRFNLYTPKGMNFHIPCAIIREAWLDSNIPAYK